VRLVVALGGNALLRRDQPLTAENQRRNVALAAAALAPLAAGHSLVISHGNGPQVGLLALQSASTDPELAYPLDILDAETEGMIGYLIEQELANRLPPGRRIATLATRIEVAADDPAFARPTKPIGPVYGEAEARRLARARGWPIVRDGAGYRRAVASPRPLRLLELGVIELLVAHEVIVICAGGGGIPVVRRRDGGYVGVEAVIDKDLASALLAREIGAEALVMLTDVDAVYTDWGAPSARRLRRIAPDSLLRYEFAAGSMAPKVAAAVDFVSHTGARAAIGRLQDAAAILEGTAGTEIRKQAGKTLWWD
jgi:carbamate kinase